MPTAQWHALPMYEALYLPRAQQQILWWKGITVTGRASPEALRPYLPFVFTLEDDRVTVVITEYGLAGLVRPVFGGGIYFHVRFRDAVGHYPIVTFACSDEVVCANREEVGEPALPCDRASITREHGTVVGAVRRH